MSRNPVMPQGSTASLAIAGLCEKFAKRGVIRIPTDQIDREIRDLSDSETVALYRVAREALRNATRHSRATAIGVRLMNTEDMVVLEVVDDGVGIDRRNADEGEKRGMQVMRKRIESVGGRFSISSSPGFGTRVRAELATRRQS